MSKKPRNERRKQKPPGRCVFCNGTRLTKEHVWSNWIKKKKIIPDSQSHTQTRIYETRDHARKIAQIFPSIDEHEGSMNQRTIRKVCRRCNEGWMSRIVDSAKPYAEQMIQDKATRLNRQNQTDLAAWISLAAIMAEFTDLATAGIPASDRTIVMQNGAPPESWTIFLGRYSGTTWSPIHYRHHGLGYHILDLPGPITISRPKPNTLQVTTYTIGSLLIHAFSATNAMTVTEYRQYRANANLIQIWPILQDDVDWPIAVTFVDKDVDSLADTFFHKFSNLSPHQNTDHNP